MSLRKRLLDEGGDDFLKEADDRAGEQCVADCCDGRDEGENDGVLDNCLALLCGTSAYDPVVRHTSFRFAGVIRGADAS